MGAGDEKAGGKATTMTPSTITARRAEERRALELATDSGVVTPTLRAMAARACAGAPLRYSVAAALLREISR